MSAACGWNRGASCIIAMMRISSSTHLVVRPSLTARSYREPPLLGKTSPVEVPCFRHHSSQDEQLCEEVSGSSTRTHDFNVFAPLNACSFLYERAQDEISTARMSTAEVMIGIILETTARSPSTVTMRLETEVVLKCCKGRMTSKLPSVPETTSAAIGDHASGSAVNSSA